VESSSHTSLELLFVGVDVRELEGLEDRRISVNEDKSLGSEDSMSVCLEFTHSSNVDMELNIISSHDKLFINLLDWVHLSVKKAVSHHDALSSSYNSSDSNWSNNWLLNDNFNGPLHGNSLDNSNLAIHKVNSFLRAGTKSVALFNKHR